MALSNWATWAIGLDNTPNSGYFKSPVTETEVEIYKNWLYVRNEKMWIPGAFIKPTIIEIQFGELKILDVNIVATRGPQNGVFVAVWTRPYMNLVGFVGCGVYGWQNNEFVGVTKEALNFLDAWIRDSLLFPKDITELNLKKFKTERRKIEWAEER